MKRLTPGPEAACPFANHNIRDGLELLEAIHAWEARAARFSTGKPLHQNLVRKAQAASKGLRVLLSRVRSH